MKTVRKFSLSMLAALAFGACSKDATETIVPVPEGEKVKTSIEFTVPSIGSTFNMNLENGSVVEEKGAETRFTVSGSTATAEKKEKAIKNLCVLQFDASGNKVTYDYVEVNGDGSDATIDVECEISAVDNSTIYFVANVQNTLNSYTKLSDFEADGIDMPTTAKWNVESEGIPMIYKYTGNVEYGKKITGIALERMFAAVKFTFTPGSNFKGSTITLCNVPKKAYFKTKAASTTAGDFFDYTVPFTSGETWYIPENKQNDVTGCTVGQRGPSSNDGKAPVCGTYFNIAGKYDKGGFIYDATYCVYLGKNNTTSFSVERNNAYTITGAVSGLNLADKRVVSVTRNLSVNHKTGAAATANCYIVGRSGVTYSFDATKKGNGSGTDATITIPAGAKPVLLWEDTQNLIQNLKLNGNEITFTVGTAGQGQSDEGNAVIALCKSDNTVLWSWHIWSTVYNPYTDYDTYKTRALTAASGKPQGTTSREVDLMTRNLGAANNTRDNLGAGGLLYQWGRKDPFVGASATAVGTNTFKKAYKSDHTASWDQDWKKGLGATIPTTKGTVAIGICTKAATVAEAVGLPMVFFATGGDWCATKTDNLWGNPYTGAEDGRYPNESKVAKSIYDPCPEGWHVPAQDTWTAFTKTGVNQGGSGNYVNANANFVTSAANTGDWLWGYKFYTDGTGTAKGNPVYYPASGLRRANTSGSVQPGELGDVGSCGYSWSASPYAAGSGNAGYLGFNSSGSVNPLDGTHRGHGFPVRCARETQRASR